MGDGSDDCVVEDTTPKGLTASEFDTFLEVLRTYTLHAIYLPPSEQWKLEVWERENPGLARPRAVTDESAEP